MRGKLISAGQSWEALHLLDTHFPGDQSPSSQVPDCVHVRLWVCGGVNTGGEAESLPDNWLCLKSSFPCSAGTFDPSKALC